MARLDGKVAIVTGGAKGIGLAIANRCIDEGARVLVGDVDPEPGAAFAASSPRARFIHLDVARESEWKAAFAYAREQFGPIDVLVNDAGISLTDDVEHASVDTWERIMAVNARGTYLGMHHAFVDMQGRGGSIVNICSIAALVGFDTSLSYSASKGAVRALTRAAAAYAAHEGSGIRVNGVFPGLIRTTMLASVPVKVLGQIEAAIPLGHIGEPRDIAELVVYLASDESAFTTGAEFVVDGGHTAV